jgi:hypothetical protein
VAGLAGTVLLQLVLPVEGHFGIDASLGFSAWFGFAVCAVMIVIARILGLLLKRPDDYYGKDP